jgi:hypothetical protein
MARLSDASVRIGVNCCKTGKLDQCGIVKYGLVPLQTRLNTDPHSQVASQCVWECDDWETSFRVL